MNPEQAGSVIQHKRPYWQETILWMVKKWDSEPVHTWWQLVAIKLHNEILHGSYTDEEQNPNSIFWKSHLNVELEKLRELRSRVDESKINAIKENSEITIFEQMAMLRELWMTSKIESSEKKIGDILG